MRTTVALLALSLLAGVAPALSEEWGKVKDPHGFEVSLPGGWSARVLADGSIILSPEAETLLGPQASVRIVHLKKRKPAAEVARELVAAYKAVLPDLTVEGPRALKGKLSDSASLRAGFTLLGERWRGVLVVSAKGRVATVTGFTAPEKDFRTLRPVFVKILASFKVNAALRDPKRIAPPSSKWRTWKDPREGAFSLRVPKGWTPEGGLVRPYIDPAAMVACRKDGKRTTQVSFMRPAVPVFVEPNAMMTQTGFGEGARYNPSGGVTQDMIVRSYRGAAGYIRNVFSPAVAQEHPDVRLVRTRPRPDFAKGQPRYEWLPTTYDGAEGEMTLTVDGTAVRGRVYVLTTRITPAGGMGLWYATVSTVNAPKGEFEQALDVFWRMRDSFRVDPTWAAKEAKSAVARSKIMAATADEIAAGMRQSYETRSRSMDEISRKWSNAILGQVDLVNPETGEVDYGVPSGSNYYWKTGDGVIGTETHARPDIDAAGLRNLDDLTRE